MMRIDIITCLPGLLVGPFSMSMVRRAVERGLVSLHVHNLRDYGVGKHKQVDDKAYGGLAGMVLMVEPVVNCIRALQKERSYDEVIYMSADGERYCQGLANRLSLKGSLILLCGHYKGVDERIREHFITRELSVGDYVLSGGELAAAVVVDSVVRLLPGVLHDATSALTDSFQDGVVGAPVYTRPAIFEGLRVPDVLRAGNPVDIEVWCREQSLERTRERRGYLLKDR